jgi:ABC-type sugar transport system permease subunit
MLYGLYLSFFEWDGVQPMIFRGLANYQQTIFGDPTFLVALQHNIVYTVGTVIGKNVIALALAVVLNGRIRGRSFFRTTLFTPVVMSFVVVGLLWNWIFNVQFGLLNTLLGAVGLVNWQSDWLGSARIALFSLIAVDVWKWYGFHLVIYLAGLQGIPTTLYEAAMIDGASAWRKFTSVTLPLLRPIVVINVTLSLMGGFNVFDLVYVMTQGGPANATNVVMMYAYIQGFKFYHLDLVYVMTQGGPANATNVVMMYAYIQGFKFYHLGYAAAISYVLMAIVIVVSALQLRLLGGERYEY